MKNKNVKAEGRAIQLFRYRKVAGFVVFSFASDPDFLNELLCCNFFALCLPFRSNYFLRGCGKSYLSGEINWPLITFVEIILITFDLQPLFHYVILTANMVMNFSYELMTAVDKSLSSIIECNLSNLKSKWILLGWSLTLTWWTSIHSFVSATRLLLTNGSFLKLLKWCIKWP